MQEVFEPDISDEEALQNFLLDIDSLDELLPWTDQFNLFDVLKISRTESCHSRMLSWLLNVHENHGFGDEFFKLFIKKVVQYAGEGHYDVSRCSSIDYSSFMIYTDWKGLDILLISEKERFIIAVENKIDSKERDQQLSHYRSVVEKEFPGYDKILIFLSPEGTLFSDVESWDTMTYGDVADILDEVNEKNLPEPDINFMIRNYKEMVRRDIMDNHQLIEICHKIYTKHKKALDLIYENCMDDQNIVGTIIKEALTDIADSGRIIFDTSQKSNTYIMFHTSDMDEYLLPLTNANSSYRTNRVYCYNIIVRDKSMYASLELGGYNITEEHRETMQKIISLHKPNDCLESDFKFKRIIRTKDFEFDNVEELEAAIRGVVEGFVDELLIMEAQLLFNLDNLDDLVGLSSIELLD